MIRRVLLVVALLAWTLPAVAAAQGLGLAGRIGTLGLGGEVAVGVTERVVLRGGIGFVPYEPSLTFSDIEVKLGLPTVYNVGVDLYLNGAVRLGGGILFRASDPEISASFTQDQDIGGTTFAASQLGTLTGVLDSKNRAPYVLIGFGRHTARGNGLFVDFGVAFMGDPSVSLSTTGGSLDPDSDATLRGALNQEASDFEEDFGGYLKLFPIFSIGVRFGAS